MGKLFSIESELIWTFCTFGFDPEHSVEYRPIHDIGHFLINEVFQRIS